MQNPCTHGSSEAPDRRGTPSRQEAFQRFMERHPYLSALRIFLAFQLSFLLLRWLFPVLVQPLHLSAMARNLLGEGLLALIVATPMLLLGWWSETGFTCGISGRGVLLCLVPTLLTVAPGFSSLPAFAGQASVSILIATTMRALLTGVAEEGLWRGVLLRTLLPGGIWVAVLLSSLGFAAQHLYNLWVGFSWEYVIGQIVTSFGAGVLLAAIRLRTGSLWPALLLHAAHDVPFLLLQALEPGRAPSSAGSGALVVQSIFCVLFLLNALLLLHPKHVRQVRARLRACLVRL